jgi:hypothetical protein
MINFINNLIYLCSISTVRKDIGKHDSEDFKKFFQYIFNLNSDKSTKLHVVPLEVAKFYLSNLFPKNNLAAEFVTFLEKEKANHKLTPDQWNLFVDFIKTFNNKFPNEYNLNDAWPTLYDEFYIAYCNKNGIKIEELNNE